MIAFFLTMPISSTMPMTPMMSRPAPAMSSGEQRADAGRRQGRENRDRVDEALVEHAEHDIHRQDRRQQQEHLVRQRGLERLRRALEVDAETRRQIDVGERGVDRVDAGAERGAGREVERDRRHRKLLEMRNLQRRLLDVERRDRRQRHLPGGRGRTTADRSTSSEATECVIDGSMSRMTRYWFDWVKMVEMMRWP